ncbi:hypothetical protein JAO73_13395 [Hymenobacter sp. BT523]|uniref:hypothetical protein n=1 Tax=Hymenobacter sp. BT523 TaxID=2795725 RepID=UPI0018EDE138|nr:hypothetical protein [Hymenobacter sp. BT523]MBJ6110011.1 hypothetical protein [Hymenobacter sp. BT523]
MKNNRLEDCCFIINVLAGEIRHSINGSKFIMERIDTEEDKCKEENYLWNIGLRYGCIKICSFLDEWNRKFLTLKAENIEATRIERVEFISKPAMDRINEFTDIHKFRNWLLAHNLRVSVQNYANVFRGNHIANMKMPTTLADYLLIRDCISHCQQAINEVFPEYYMKPMTFINANSDRNYNKGLELDEYEIETQKVKAAIERNRIADSTNHIS